MMKHEKIEIYRPQYDCWTCSPIRARLTVLFNLHNLVRMRRVHITLMSNDVINPYWLLAIPKINYIKVSKEELKEIKAADVL